MVSIHLLVQTFAWKHSTCSRFLLLPPNSVSVCRQINSDTANALTRADPKLSFKGNNKLQKKDRKSYRLHRTNLYITEDALRPLPRDDDYEDLAGVEAVQLVVSEFQLQFTIDLLLLFITLLLPRPQVCGCKRY